MSTIEELLLRCAVAQYNAMLCNPEFAAWVQEREARLHENSRCNNVIFDSGERAGQCNSSNVADPLNLPFCDECLKANPKLREDA